MPAPLAVASPRKFVRNLALAAQTLRAAGSRHARLDKHLHAALINAAAVGTGGFVGALARYGLGGFVHRQFPQTTFPVGTLTVNLAGCLLIGLLAGLVESRQLFGPETRAFVLIGILGGFTTFSTFGFETFALLRDGEYLRSAANVGFNVVFGLVLVWLGYTLVSSR